MKQLTVLGFVLLVILIPSLLFFSSCESVGEDRDFYISFTMDGQEYILSFGYPDVSTYAPMVVLYIGDTRDDIFLFGINWEEGEDTSGIVVDFWGWLYPDTQGEYLGDYTLAGVNGLNSIYIGYGDFDFDIWDDLDRYNYESTAGTVTITSFGNVGGAVEGAFDITFEGGIKPAALGGSPLAIPGYFRLLRVSEDDFPIEGL